MSDSEAASSVREMNSDAITLYHASHATTIPSRSSHGDDLPCPQRNLVSLCFHNESHTATAHISASSVKEGVVGRASAANSRSPGCQSLMPKSTLALATKTGFQSFEVSVLPVSVTSALPQRVNYSTLLQRISTTTQCFNAISTISMLQRFNYHRCCYAMLTPAEPLRHC